MMKTKNEKIVKVLSHNNHQSLQQNYDQWAEEYDKDLQGKLGYKVPSMAAQSFANVVPKNARILDAESGTGIVGEVLSKLDYQDIEALDLSKGMLEQAKLKGVYRDFHHQMLGERLDFSSNTFNAIIAVGTFGKTHAPPHALDELLRILVPHGYIVFTMSISELEEVPSFKQKFEELEQQCTWQLIEQSKVYQGFNQLTTVHTHFCTFVYKKLIPAKPPAIT